MARLIPIFENRRTYVPHAFKPGLFRRGFFFDRLLPGTPADFRTGASASRARSIATRWNWECKRAEAYHQADDRLL